MSRLFPERLLLRFFPDELAFGAKRISCDPRFGSDPWHGAAARLQELELGRATVTLELSNHFVRYELVPWNDALTTPAEEEIYVRHHFARIYGERAKSWAVRAAPASPGHPRIATAVDAALIEALKKSFEGKAKARLVSIQPALMLRFNSLRKSVPKLGAWLVIAEAERACIALHSGREWRSVQNAKGEWREALERERHRVEGGSPSLVLLIGASAPANDPFFQFRSMAT